MGNEGAVTYLFNKKGQLEFPSKDLNEDQQLELALEIGAEDLIFVDNKIHITCPAPDLFEVKRKLESKGITSIDFSVTYLPTITVPIKGERYAILT